jgi:hypothetical protein
VKVEDVLVPVPEPVLEMIIDDVAEKVIVEVPQRNYEPVSECVRTLLSHHHHYLPLSH